jgi:transcriptional regulator with XRE-family HTH domain
MKNKITYGAVIKEARESLGLTQRGLAAEVGVKASHIAYIEGNRRKPSLSLLRKLVLVLGLDRNREPRNGKKTHGANSHRIALCSSVMALPAVNSRCSKR